MIGYRRLPTQDAARRDGIDGADVVCDSVQPILALLGHSVAGNPTQFTMERAFHHHQLEWRFLSLEVSPDLLGDAVRGMRAMGFRGGICSDPHKEAVVPLLDRLLPAAERAGAVNCIVREDQALVGENSEGQGCLAALRKRADPAGKRVVLLGSGRVARAIAAELAEAKAAEIHVVCRNQGAGRAIVDHLQQRALQASLTEWNGLFVVPAETGILIDATSAASQAMDDPAPIDLGQLKKETVVADVTFNPPRIWLLSEAARCGCPTVPGLEMLIEQAALNFRLWTGIDPDRTVLREAAEEFLEL